MFNARDFRDALGGFATGVTIVTTCDVDGSPVGVTVSSYNSVSLEPPLVLWSLARTARSMLAFKQAKAFTIHVLSRDQQDLAKRFASSGADKFADLEYGRAHGDVPLLAGCATHFECEAAYQYDGGDHVIFVGRVMRFQRRECAPLLFHRGQFTEVLRPSRAVPEPGDRSRRGRYTDDFLPYLLGRAQMQFSHRLRQHYGSLGVTDTHYATLGLLSMLGAATGGDIERRLAYTGQAPSALVLFEMADRGWVTLANDGKWRLTPEGRTLLLSVLSRSRAMEEDLLAKFDPEQVQETKAFLRLMIDRTSEGLPPLWDDA
jgi:3-hydroxy-9,10-secoandrosta-1,3,5(10)-triene-9,17-dione monooxygenase reductase component